MKFDPRLLRLVRSSRLALSVAILSGLAGGALAVVQARWLSRAVAGVFLHGQDLLGVSGLLGGLLAVFALRAAALWVGEVAGAELAIGVKTRLRRQLFEKLLLLGPTYAGGERTGELAATAVEGIEALDAYFSQYLPQVILAVLVPITFLAFIFPLEPLSALILLVTAPLIPLFMILIGGWAEALTRRQWQTLSRLSAHFLDVLQGLATLKILGRSRSQGAGIAQAGESYRQTTMAVLRVTFLSALALELIATLSTAVVAVEVGLRLLYGRLAFEQAFFVLLLAPEFYLPLRQLGTRFHAGMAGVAAAGRIFEITTAGTGRQTEEWDWRLKAGDQRSAATGRLSSTVHHPPSIVFDNAGYTYPDGRQGLNGLSFEVLPGQRVALVGASGAGKSTTAGLLLRFMQPQAGRILVDGQPLAAVPEQLWREQVAWLPQAPFLFNDTVAANLRLARPEATREELVAAARQANAHEFIERLPQGYDTPIGERGARLSGGQAQRIALGRAFLKNAPLLILDEPTAALDPELEDQVQASLARLSAGRTVLTIAHHLHTVRQADWIVVLDRGRAVETGTHTELVERGGLYRELVEGSLAPEAIPGANAVPGPDAVPGAPSPQDASGGRFAIPLQSPIPNFESPAPPPGSPISNLKSLPTPLLRLLHLISPYKAQVALSVVLGFATVGSGVGLMATSADIIARAALHPSIAELQVAIVGVRFFGLARGVFRYLERYVSHQVTFRLLARLRVWFYEALEPLAPARLASYRGGDLLNRATGGTASLESFYVRALAPPLVALLSAAFMGIFLSFYSPVLALALLAALALAGVGAPLLAHFLGGEAGRRLARGKASLSADLVDGVQGMAELLVFGQAGRQLEKVEAAGREVACSQRVLARSGGLITALESLCANLGMWAVLYLAIPLVRSGRIDGVALPVLALAALTCFEAVQPLPAAAQNLEGNLEAARRLFELVDAEPEVEDSECSDDFSRSPLAPITTKVVTTKGSPHPYDLEVNHLSFVYPLQQDQRDQKVQPLLPYSPAPLPYALHDLSFTLPSGCRMAIVGPSGAGKSTLLSLLLRFWEYREGEILLGGRDLRCWPQEAVRSCMAVVSQHTHLFNASVRENLLLARPKAGEEDLVGAARRAQIHDFIQSLPQGYDTWIGEQGLRLSGGERQRLALARALLKDAPLLLLDEPAANLDALTAREVMNSIYSTTEGRTVLLVTHSLAGLQAMDEILVLHQGRVIERGTHGDLLVQGGFYRRMWEVQNQMIEGIPENVKRDP